MTLVLMTTVVAAVGSKAADAPVLGRSVCEIAGDLMAGCSARIDPRPSVGEITLEFDVGGSAGGVVQSISDATGKTVLKVVAPPEDRDKRMPRPTDGLSDWCAQLKRN